jgi:hypothetical protein
MIDITNETKRSALEIPWAFRKNPAKKNAKIKIITIHLAQIDKKFFILQLLLYYYLSSCFRKQR